METPTLYPLDDDFEDDIAAFVRPTRSKTSTIANRPKSEVLERARRRNLRTLFRNFVMQQVKLGKSQRGMEARFAAAIQMPHTRWWQIKSGSLGISDRTAGAIEQAFDRCPGWLDIARGPRNASMTPAEKRMIRLVLKVFRSIDDADKLSLEEMLLAVAEGQVAGGISETRMPKQ